VGMKITSRFGKNLTYRRSMMKNLTTSLVEHGQIYTTFARAMELRRFADRMILLSKKGTPAAKHQAGRIITSPQVVNKLFMEYPERFKNRQCGFTRVRRAGFRTGDGAPMAWIEIIRDDLSMKPEDYGIVPQAEL